ncbi:MAG TPA: V4R domain-containing protein [Longimicrobiaceae bacterium]|nr:V4R domain-containing protein [Longimicrobiaceae bacterium]
MTAPAERFLRLPAGFLRALHQALAQGHDSAEAATLLREIGYELGDPFYAMLEETLSPGAEESLRSVTPSRFWSGISSVFENLGWGSLQWAQPHPAIAALDSTDWIEAEERQEVHPSCHLTTGVLAKLLAHAADAEVAVLETECRSRGDQRCRFLFGSPEALDMLYQEMRMGIPYSAALARLA